MTCRPPLVTLLVLLLLTLVPDVHGSARSEFGVFAGGGGSKIHFGIQLPEGSEEKWLTAPRLGVSYGIRVRERASSAGLLEAGLVYVRRGMIVNFESVPGPDQEPDPVPVPLREDIFVDETKIRLEYISVPVVYRQYFGAGTARMTLFGGAEAAFLLSAEEVDLRSTGLSEGTVTRRANDVYEGVDVGVVIGGGADWEVGGGQRVFMEVLGVFGQGNVRVLAGGENPDFTYKNRSVVLVLGYRRGVY